MPIFLTNLLKERGKWKSLYKKAVAEEDEVAKKKFWSLQYAMKVLMNGTGYGINTPPNVLYGDLSVGVLITGIGRWIIKHAIEFIEGKGFPCIEYDTDGTYHIYGSASFPHDLINEINQYLEELVTKVGPESKIEMEGTLWQLMYAYKTKNYFLYSKGRWDDDGRFFFDDTINLKGSAFKSSAQATFIDKFISGMVKLIIDDADEDDKINYIKEKMNIKQYSMAELTRSVRPTMMPHEYKTKNLGKRLMLMAQAELNIPPTPYMFYEYVNIEAKKKGDPREMLTARATPEDLDYQAYRKLIKERCSRFGLEDQVAKYVETPGFREIKQMEYS
jgi:DNA polymerase elongation subunit (family B)